MDSQHTTMHPEMARALQQLFDCVPPHQLQKTLRSLMLEYMSQRAIELPLELTNMTDELICLFRFLDAAAECTHNGTLPLQHARPGAPPAT